MAGIDAGSGLYGSFSVGNDANRREVGKSAKKLLQATAE
jgi:hypothetical protein